MSANNNNNNLHEVTSTTHFQELLSADLNRISLINFWAPWAEPCKQMNEVVSELAKKYPTVLFLQVEAEGQDAIAESFDVEAVPSFVLLRGHTLLARISGADASALTDALTKHTRPSYTPQSQTSQQPAPPPTSAFFSGEETPEQLEQRLRGLMNQSKVVLFMKGSPGTPRCGFSRKMVNLLKTQNVEFNHFDILTDESVRQGLKKLNEWPTFPQLIIKGEFVGGLDVAQEMADNGELGEMLAA
ncbi:hypothetical protein AMATHDRAFT_49865 [Amanita thiersii Skay4041]|uniref:Thioredoxin domain-containing protein n=1 Tax=Amanita thiersii Skay4041 TaxID=703135 RepID=A0A2A9NIB1_9AGAR|nr:hypothetical protein AMATHDRAFT_49865 [Amanita thiersii Skay4041]